MKFIISPAKTMKSSDDFAWRDLPRYVDRAELLSQIIRDLAFDEMKALWKTSDTLTKLNHERFLTMDVRGETQPLTPAIFSYEGIQYQHMAPAVMDAGALEYLQDRLRILSGFYGIVRPFDGVVPYRLEMQAKLCAEDSADLYGLWNTSLAGSLAETCDTVVNLASVEYARAVIPHAVESGLQVVTCVFGFLQEGRFIQRATAAKAARGSMVRWAAENDVTDRDDLRAFDVSGYRFCERLSEPDRFVFTIG